MISQEREQFFLHAKNRIPGWTQLLSKRPDQFSEGVWPSYYERAKGVQVWDLDGQVYTDMSISGIGANVLGYADQDVDDAVISAIRKGSSSSLNCREEIDLADALCWLHPWADQVRFARTGGESMTIAVRIARATTGRSKVAFCGYHGWHDWYLAANLKAEKALDDHLIPGLDPQGVPRELAGTALPFRFNDLEGLSAIVAAHGDDLAAIVLEPIRYQGPTEAFLSLLQEVRAKTGTIIIIDEISAGFRVALGGAHLNFAYDPDIAVFSKALGNGYPIGAVIGKKHVMNIASQLFISSTCWTERVGFTAGLAMLQKFEKHQVHLHLTKIGNMVQSGWKIAAEEAGVAISVSGIPPLSHFAFVSSDPLALKALFVQLMVDQGFLASNLFYAMYAHQESHVVSYLEAVKKAFLVIKEAESTHQVHALLRGKPAKSGFYRLN